VTTVSLTDVRVDLEGPAGVSDGQSFTEAVTVANGGPAVARNVLSSLVVPRGLSVVNAAGGRRLDGLVLWSTPLIVAGGRVPHVVTLRVGARAQGTVRLWAGAASLTVRDPDYSNNSDSEPLVVGVTAKK
jgi:Domain of unknown function DUF11